MRDRGLIEMKLWSILPLNYGLRSTDWLTMLKVLCGVMNESLYIFIQRTTL